MVKPKTMAKGTAPDAPNLLYYGDNMDVLKRHVKEASVDLVYLDPPFNSAQDYNVLFAEHDKTKAAAQIKAFGDTWRWDEAAALAFQGTVELGGAVSQALQAFRTFLGDSDMLAYLSMMAPRLVELRRVLKETGSIYLHCDSTASHYLKILMDAVFAPVQFKNEIVWKRTGAHGSAKRYGPVHDSILFYSRGDSYIWNPQYQDQAEYVAQRYTYEDTKGKFYPITLHATGVRNGSSGKPWRGIDITAKGGHWKYTVEKLDELDAAGVIYWPARGSMPRLKVYAEDAKGAQLQDWWDDIPVLNSQAAERLGYPTQKPEALLERILIASSNEGDVVLDPFCGCGTAVAVAHRLKRRWIGIDITHLSINLIRHRLQAAFGEDVANSYKVLGEPVSVEDAAQLAADDPYQFQWWALGLVGARPVEQKKGADKGIDGRLYFHGDQRSETEQIIFSVKAGGTSVPHVRDLRGVLDREKAAMGVLITMQEPTKPMRTEAASAGFYDSKWEAGVKHPRLQIITVGELLDGRRIDCPPLRQLAQTFKQAPRVDKVAHHQQLTLVADEPEGYKPKKRKRD